MAYWLVYLPERNPSSFVLLVNGRLRDYSASEPPKGEDVDEAAVLAATVVGTTRFLAPRRTVAHVGFWRGLIAERNAETLGAPGMEPLTHSDPFIAWRDRWLDLREFGATLDDVDGRIARALELWHDEVPEPWRRGDDDFALGYRRSDVAAPSREGLVEAEILKEPLRDTTFEDARLAAGLNAFALVDRRRGGVIADLLLLFEGDAGFRLVVGEVKDGANNAWHAALQNLLQLRLLTLSPAALRFFARRGLGSPAGTAPVTGLVIGRPSSFTAGGKSASALAGARDLVARFRAEGLADCRIATWDRDERELRPFA